MTTTEPTPTLGDLDLPAWLNVEALLTDADLIEIQEAHEAAHQAVEQAVRLRRIVEPIREQWKDIFGTAEDGPFELLADATGYTRLLELLVLAGDELMQAWDPASVPSDEYMQKLRADWSATFPGVNR